LFLTPAAVTVATVLILALNVVLAPQTFNVPIPRAPAA
jgi:hypothetical protein